MKAARYYGPGDVRIEQIPEPTPRKDEVKLKVAWNGICGSDLHNYESRLYLVPSATSPNEITGEVLPIGMGHEFSGTVVEVGEGVDTNRLPVGQNVVVEPLISCLKSSCNSCSIGTRNVCPHANFIGLAGWGGGLAEFVCVKQELVHVLPTTVPLDIGAMVEPLAVVWHAVKRSSFKPGDTVLVIGAGPIGLLLLAVLKAQDAGWIGVSEPAARRRETALKRSISAAYDPTRTDVAAEILTVTNGRGADVVFDCAGVQASLSLALAAVRPRGNVMNVAIWGPAPAQIDMNVITMKEVLLTSSIGYDRVHPEVLKALGEGKFPDLSGLITRKIPLEDTVQKGIVALMEEKDTQIKILVHP